MSSKKWTVLRSHFSFSTKLESEVKYLLKNESYLQKRFIGDEAQILEEIQRIDEMPDELSYVLFKEFFDPELYSIISE